MNRAIGLFLLWLVFWLGLWKSGGFLFLFVLTIILIFEDN